MASCEQASDGQSSIHDMIFHSKISAFLKTKGLEMPLGLLSFYDEMMRLDEL